MGGGERGDGKVGRADLGDGGAAETAKNIPDAPDREADHQEADDGGHHRLAEPVGGGLPQPSKHASSVIEKTRAAARYCIIGRGALHRNIVRTGGRRTSGVAARALLTPWLDRES